MWCLTGSHSTGFLMRSMVLEGQADSTTRRAESPVRGEARRLKSSPPSRPFRRRRAAAAVLVAFAALQALPLQAQVQETPTVTIAADKTIAVFKEDGITYTLTRTGSTTDALPVTVRLMPAEDFLAATELTDKTVTIGAGQSTATLTVAASSFQHFAEGTKVVGGPLTAAVQDGSAYDLGTTASVAVRITPGPSGQGLMLRFAPEWGRTASATERLWSALGATALGADSEFEGDSRLTVDAGYGVGLAHGHGGVLTPYAGLTLGDAGSRTVHTGARWQVSPDAVLALEATRQTSDAGETDNQMLRLALRF